MGVAGAVVSITNVDVTALDVLPAASVAVADTVLLPFAFRLRVPELGVAVCVFTDQVPPVAVVLNTAPPMLNDTELPASAVPDITGVASLDVVPDVIATAGALVSKVKFNVDAADTLPAASV